eukprot:5400881-Pyramimonas_sp.AAC.1
MYASAFQQWQVDPKTAELIARLHRMAWFQYADLHEVVQKFTGGRQGCVFGTVMFNGAYSIALFMLYSELAKLGLGLR